MKKFLLHLFIPHYSNNHHPKALHLDALLTYILVFAVLNLALRYLSHQYPQVLGYATDIRAESLLSETNERRQALGLTPLQLNEQLTQAAIRKAQDMFNHNYWAHNSPTGKTPWDFIVGSGYRYVLAGENLAKNFQNSDGVVEAWMNSSTHRDNIVKAGYREIGLAVVNGILNGEETTLVVQLFGTRSVPSLAEAKPLQPTPVIPRQAAQAEQPSTALAVQPQLVMQAFSQVTNKPLINLPTLSRDIIFIFAGVLLGVLAIDAWIINRKGIVRLTGHNFAHILFIVAILIAINFLEQRGSLI